MPRASARELISVGTLIALMRPQIVFGMTRPLPPVWSSPRHLRPAKSFARSLPALELAGRKIRSGYERILRLFHANELVSEVERIFERLFSKQHGVADKSRLLINATSGVPGYRQ